MKLSTIQAGTQKSHSRPLQRRSFKPDDKWLAQNTVEMRSRKQNNASLTVSVASSGKKK
jgi:hypothetical protein